MREEKGVKLFSKFNLGHALFAVLFFAVALRLIGIGYGLPAVFNSDEPHIVNTAVSFGSGDFNPHRFKYPTLWMYLLFFVYGIYFVFL